MGSDTSRSWRGWLYAALVAVLLSTTFWYADQYSKRKKLEFFRADRTTKHTAVSTAFRQDFDMEEAPLVFQESIDLDETKAWSQFRSEPVSVLEPSLEPLANAQLLAPTLPANIRAIEASEIASTEPPFPIGQGSTRVVSTRIDSKQEAPLYTSAGMKLSDSSVSGWPRPNELLLVLEGLRDASIDTSSSSIYEWSTQAKDLIEGMSVVTTMQDPQLSETFQQLRKLCEPILQNEEKGEGIDPDLVKARYRAAYAILRRVMVWQSVWRCLQQDGERQEVESPSTLRSEQTLVSTPVRKELDLSSIEKDVLEIRKSLRGTGDEAGWNRYLMLDALQELAESHQLEADPTMQTARIFLSRVTWKRVSDAQRSLLAQEAIQRVASKLHPLAYGPVDYRQLLIDLETMEADPIHRCRTSIAQQVQALRFSSTTHPLELADQINTFYRNANLRIAVSEALLQRCLPKSQVVERPVHSRILGADTRGASQVHTHLAIDLIPDKQAWNIALRLKGDIHSNTQSSKGPATFYNNSLAMIDTTRKIRVDVQGLHMSSENANVSSSDRLRGFNTDFDSLPLLGDMLRFVVRQQFDSERGLAQRIMRRTIAEQADSEFSRTLSSKVSDAEKQLHGKLLKPLEKMELNPLVVDLETTEQRLIARYRVAGSGQLAAHTPRPLAPSDSHLSVQVHESAINNAIDRFGLSGRDWTLPELGQQLADVLEQTGWEMSSDIPHDISIRFADSRPITIEFVDGRMDITLRIAEIYQPEKMRINDFVIKTSYVPTAHGMFADMVHKGPISVDYPKGMRDRLTLRTIFARIFAARQVLPLINQEVASDPRAEGLAISQATIQDGWMALAASHRASPHVAHVQSQYSSEGQTLRR